MQVLTENIKKRIKKSVDTRNRLAYIFKKHVSTIDRWVEENNIILTTPDALKAISEETGVPESKLLTEA